MSLASCSQVPLLSGRCPSAPFPPPPAPSQPTKTQVGQSQEPQLGRTQTSVRW